jgi:tRNA(Glu) U13 pseudouridine synthase TruD
MDDIERFIKIVQQKRQADQRELEHLDVDSDEHKTLMKKLRNLKSMYSSICLKFLFVLYFCTRLLQL